MAKQKTDQEQPRSFEENLQRLEKIVELLDKAQQPMEELLALYEEGMAVSLECKRYLEKAELRITTLTVAAQKAASGE